MQEKEGHVLLTSTGSLIQLNEDSSIQENWALQRFTLLEGRGQHFAERIGAGTATTCGKRAFKGIRSTGGFTSFDSKNLNDQIEGANKVPVHLDDNMANYGELGGIDKTIAVTNIVCKAFNVTSDKLLTE